MTFPQPAAPTGRGGADQVQVWTGQDAADGGGSAQVDILPSISTDFLVRYVVLTVSTSTGAATLATPTDTLYLNVVEAYATWDQTCVGKGAFSLGGYNLPRLIRGSGGEHLIAVADGCDPGDLFTVRVEYTIV